MALDIAANMGEGNDGPATDEPEAHRIVHCLSRRRLREAVKCWHCLRMLRMNVLPGRCISSLGRRTYCSTFPHCSEVHIGIGPSVHAMLVIVVLWQTSPERLLGFGQSDPGTICIRPCRSGSLLEDRSTHQCCFDGAFARPSSCNRTASAWTWQKIVTSYRLMPMLLRRCGDFIHLSCEKSDLNLVFNLKSE